MVYSLLLEAKKEFKIIQDCFFLPLIKTYNSNFVKLQFLKETKAVDLKGMVADPDGFTAALNLRKEKIMDLNPADK